MTIRYRRARRPFPTIQAWMDSRGYRQEDVAKLAGISQSHLCNILRKRRGCSLDVALRLSELTNVPLDAIVDRRLHLVKVGE